MVNTGSGSGSGATGGTLKMTMTASGSSAWGALTVAAGSKPNISWTVASDVIGTVSYEVLVYSNTTIATAWDVTYTNTSLTSVVYGNAPAGSTITCAPISLTKGSYNVVVHARNANAIDNLVGYANGVITVN